MVFVVDSTTMGRACVDAMRTGDVGLLQRVRQVRGTVAQEPHCRRAHCTRRRR